MLLLPRFMLLPGLLRERSDICADTIYTLLRDADARDFLLSAYECATIPCLDRCC